ncbi:MAG TPA: SpaH/EbpB family LPXTG-anchored major pilin [Cerasibacillus sp.]|uniref:SpaH/EbpB family LPXTG-anchored major pilin n=1 Tax=Cerasibacillus sp. TaxID=2498711 RepID=UPI002F3F07C6
MQIAKRKSLNIFLALTLLVSLILPNFAFAEENKKPIIKGDKNNPTLTIHKFEQEPGADEGEEGTGLPGQNAKGEPVEGVEFTLTQTHKYNSETDIWEEVSGGKTIKKQTGENGQVVFTKGDGLELGRYKVEETDGPDHIILNPESFYVDVPMTSKDGTSLNYDVHIYPKNEIIRGDAELIKKGEDGKILEDVVFGLYDEDGNEIEQLTTNSEGKVSVENLDQGKYYFQEIKTVDGYAINTDKIYFEVVAGEQNKVEWTTIDGFVDENGVVTNYKKPEIEKDVEEKEHHVVDRDKEYVYNITVTTPGDIENYSILGVTDVLDDRLEFITDGSIEEGWTVTGTTKDNIEFTQNEQELVWEVKDLSLLQPNSEIKITFTAKIRPDAKIDVDETGIENTAQLDFNNDKGSYTKPNPNDPEEPPTPPEEPPTTPPVTVEPTEGGLKIIKVDKSDHNVKLQGAEFKLTTDKEGNNVVDATGTVVTVNGEAHEGLLENLVTNENGEIVIEGLTPGTYYLHETKAPTYTDEDGTEKSYRLLTKSIEVKVENNSTENKGVIVENSKSGWELPTTGGIGTILFTIIGLALMMTAFVLYLRRRKEEQVA